MKTILLVDASSDCCAVALSHGGKHYSLCQQQPRKHAQLLLPSINHLLSQANISLKELDGIGYGRGPGSFAGIRIAASVTQGISLAQSLPVYGFSSLLALAKSAAKQYVQLNTDQSPLFTIVNAHMGEVFWAGFNYHLGSLRCQTGEHIGDLNEAIDAYAAFSNDNANTVIVGDAMKLPNVQSSSLSSAPFFSDVEIDLSNLLGDVSLLHEQGQFGEFKDHQPVYLRDSVSWKKLDEQPKLLQPKKSN